MILLVERPSYYRRLFLSPLMAAVYDLWVWIAVLGRTARLRRKIHSFVPRNAKVAVDLATGTGATAIAIKQAFPKPKVFASDLSPAMLKIADKKARKADVKIKFSIQDAVKTSYPSQFADFVSITFAIHDLPREKRVAVMKEARRILKKNGIFAIYEYHAPENPLFWPLMHLQFFLAENREAYSIFGEDLGAELKSLGFRNVLKKTHYASMAQIVAGQK